MGWSADAFGVTDRRRWGGRQTFAGEMLVVRIGLMLLLMLAATPALADSPTPCEGAQAAELKRMSAVALTLQFCERWRTARLNDDGGNDNMKQAAQLRKDGNRRGALDAAGTAGSFFSEADACRNEAVGVARVLEKEKKVSGKQYEALIRQNCPDVAEDMDAIIAATKGVTAGTALPKEPPSRLK